DGPLRKRPRLIEVLDSTSMVWTDQEKETREALLQDSPNVIVKGGYSPGKSNFLNFVKSGVFFGKSTNLSMLYTFLKLVSEQEKEQKRALFKGLKVAQFDWFMKLHLGNWPVIYISFKDLNYESWESMLSSIRKRISDLYQEHCYIMDNKKLYKNDESLFTKTLDGTIDNSYLMDALSSMSRYLHEYFGKQAIILIDEYDWSMEHAGNFYDSANSFFRSMYSMVAKVLFVGLLPLGQASFLFGLNNVVHYQMHKLPGIYGRAKYSDMFGFAKAEVKLLLSKNNQNFELDNLRSQYNGYQTSTVNSSSTVTVKECLKKCSKNIEEELQSLYYSFYSLQDDDSLQNQVKVKLMPHLRYDVLENEPEINAIYTLLCYSGYLTVNFDDKFNNKIIDFIGVDRLMTSDIFNSLFKKDIKVFCEQFPALYMEIISCFDIGDSKRAKLYESWYYTFVLGALAMYHSNYYQVVSNREAGNGRPDVCIISINPKFDTCIIFEFKLAKSKDHEGMRKLAMDRLKQITDKNYRLNTASHIEAIVEVAIAFFKKDTFVSAQLLQRKKGGKKGKLSTNNWDIVSSASPVSLILSVTSQTPILSSINGQSDKDDSTNSVNLEQAQSDTPEKIVSPE
ncbi:34174_t:CDS:10, partial [Racocetra persica]